MSDPIFKKVDYSVRALIEEIALGKIGLPDIQRPFVWPNVKVRDLLDSMYRGYPVGYLLFWENGLDSSPRTIGSDVKQLSPNLVIVDGQQRLTSLYAVIRGVPVVRSNYRSERISISFNPMEGVFEVRNAAIDRDKSFIPDISRLWENENSYMRVRREFVDGLRSVGDLSHDQEDRIEAAITKLRGLHDYAFSVLQLSSDISEEAVSDVFVRINSQGKALNQADFILTLMSVFWDRGRTELESFCRQTRIPPESGVSPHNHFIEPSPDQLLRAGVGLAFRRARLENVYSILRGKDLETGRFSEEGRDTQFEKLKGAQSKVLNLQYWHDFMLCLRHAGYRSKRMITSQATLIYSYVLYLIGRTEFQVPEKVLRPAIAQWFFMSALTGRYSGAPESRMESDLALLRGVTTSEDFIAILRTTCNIALTADFWEVTLPNDLAVSSARSPSLFAYEAAQVLLGDPVLFSKFKVAEMLDPSLNGGERSLERHHLFPRAHLAKLGINDTRDVNQIANYAYVEWIDNVVISDKPPQEYLPIQEQAFGHSDLAQMYENHGLPDRWETMGYYSFLERRRELMAKIVREGYERIASDGSASETLQEVEIASLIDSGESEAIEFKSTLRTNLHTRRKDSRMEHTVLKTLAGFLNQSGGTLVIGVSDDGSPIGLDVDEFESEDRMSLHLSNIVNDRMGPNVWHCMHANFEDLEDVRVLVVRCEKAHSPVYLRDSSGERFYIRTGSSTTELTLSQAQEHIKQRFS